MSLPRVPSSIEGGGVGTVFQLLRDGVPRTRAEVAAETGLARAAVSARVEQLLRSGLLVPASQRASSGGRPPAQFSFDSLSRVVIAIDAGARHLTVAIVDLAGRVITERTLGSSIADGPVAVLDRASAEAQDLLGEAGYDPSRVLAVGIGLPGPVAFAVGRPANPPIMPGWHDYDVPGHITRTFPVAVYVDNDVNIMALGERARAWPHTDHLVFVKVATGIGSGIISAGRLQRGAQGIAGDIGHVRVPRGVDVPCSCGNSGCLEAIAAVPAIVRSLNAVGQQISGIAGLDERVRAGDVAALEAVRQAGRDVGEVLSACVSLVNPSVIVVGGSLARAGDQLIAGIREVVYSRGMPLATAALQIVPSALGSEAAIIGAATLAIEGALSVESVDALLA